MTVVAGAFDRYDRGRVRLLEKAAQNGPVELRLSAQGQLPIEERVYQWTACRFVDRVTVVSDAEVEIPSADDLPPYQPPSDLAAGDRPKVVVTGCYDWLHSGHLRFFEVASAYGELTVMVANDRNVALLKGEGHPMFPAQERRYLVASVRHVARSLISQGEGWLDAAAEIEAMKPDFYVVNEDGDKPEKAAFCRALGIEYIVLQRRPADGLPRRESTVLRGF